MLVNRIRLELDRWWAETDPVNVAAKDPNRTLGQLREKYESLSLDEKNAARLVLAEWLTQPDEGKSWCAWAMVELYEIREALPQLTKYVASLKATGLPLDRSHAERVEETVAALRKR